MMQHILQLKTLCAKMILSFSARISLQLEKVNLSLKSLRIFGMLHMNLSLKTKRHD